MKLHPFSHVVLLVGLFVVLSCRKSPSALPASTLTDTAASATHGTDAPPSAELVASTRSVIQPVVVDAGLGSQATTNDDAGVPAALSRNDLFLYRADEHGLHKIRYDGTVVHTYTTERVTYPRVAGANLVWLDAEGTVYVAPITGGAVRRVVSLSHTFGLNCKGMPSAPYNPVSHIKSTVGMFVGTHPQELCVYLQGFGVQSDDGDQAVITRVDLAHGKVSSMLQLGCGNDSLAEQAGVGSCEIDFDFGSSGGFATDAIGNCPPGSVQQEAEVVEPDTAYGIEDTRVVKRVSGSAPVTVHTIHAGDLISAMPSQDLNWFPLVARSGSDVQNLMLNLRTGEVFALRAGVWPRAYDDQQLSHLLPDNTGDITAQAGNMCWLPGGAFLNDNLIVDPGHGAVSYQGEIAR